MKFPWITLTSCTAAAAAAWFAGRATAPVEPPPSPPQVQAAAPPAVTTPAPPLAPPPVLADVLALAAASAGETDGIARQQTLQKAARLLSNATAAEARELFLTTGEGFLQECALRRWAELEPQPALDHLLRLNAQQRLQLAAGFKPLLRALFQGWAHADPLVALRAASKCPREVEFSEIEYAVICQAVADDVTRGLALLAEKRVWATKGSEGGRQMWDRQPAAFTRGLFALSTGSLKDTPDWPILRLGVDSARAWAAADAGAFTAWAAQHFAAGPREDRCHAELFGLFLTHDPEAAGAAFAATPPSALRNKMREQYVAHLAAADPQAAVQWLETNLTSGRDAAYRTWAESIAKASGHEQAAALADALPPGRSRDAASEAALYAWAGKDVNAAVAWAKAQPAPDGTRAAITHLAYPWLQHHGPEAARYILQNPALGWSETIIRSATRQAPFAEAVALAGKLPETHAQEAAQAIGERLARDGTGAKAIAALTTEQQLTAIRAAAEELSFTDKSKAAAWVAALPAGPLRSAGQAAIVKTAKAAGSSTEELR